MDQWRSKFSESFSLDRHWSIECSSLSHDVSNVLVASHFFGSKLQSVFHIMWRMLAAHFSIAIA